MSEPKASRRFSFKILIALVFLASILFVGGANYAITTTNTNAFCTSCHTMHTNYEEYQDSLHYKNASGVRATCADCHVPKEFGPKILTKIIAAKDVYHEVMGTISTKEKFEARRWQMANSVWRKMARSDSRECRTCHDFESMDLSEQSRSARALHASAEDKGKTCIDCHKGVVHTEPYPPDAPTETPEATAETAPAEAETADAS